MSWFKVDDGFASHPKTRSIPRSVRMRAVGVWTACGTWSARHLTDGLIPRDVVEDEGGKRADATALVASGLWHEHGHECSRCIDPSRGSYVFHDWADYQPVKEKVLAERRATADRVARHRQRKNGSSNGVTGGVSNDAPVPSRPGPTSSLVTLVCRRLSGDARVTTTDDEIELWREAAGGADLEVELKAWLIHNAETDLREPGAALLGWLRRAAKREAERHDAVSVDPDADIRPPGGCGAPGCVDGYLGYDDEERPVPCRSCRPHLRPVGETA